MKRLFPTLFFILSSVIVSAQQTVSIGTETTNQNAVLWLKGNGNQGLIVPIVPATSSVTAGQNEKGMIVFSDADRKLYVFDGSVWSEIGNGSGVTGGGSNYALVIQGNSLVLQKDGNPQNTISISANAPAQNALLIWDGSRWNAAVLTGDVSSNNGTITVNGLKGKAVPNLPTTTQALVYNGTNWVFQPLTGTPAVDNLTLELNATNQLQVRDGGITNAKVASGIAVSKLAPGANGEILTVSGGVPLWQSRAGASGAAGGDLTGTYPNPTLATTAGNNIVAAINNATTTATINAARIGNFDASKITTGSIGVANGGTGITTTPANGQLLIGNGSGYSLGSLSAGTGLTVTPGAGTLSLLTSGNFGAQNLSTSGTITSGNITTTGITTTGAINATHINLNTLNYTWPNSHNVAGAVLTNDGSGGLSWSTGVAGWGLTGNAGTNPSTNFIGTTGPQDLVFRANAIEQMRISFAGNIGVGTSVPNSKFEVFSNSGAASNHAVRGSATGSSSQNFGVYGDASGGGTAYGVYGFASGATTNWAGYFDGNAAILGALGVGPTTDFGATGQVLTSQGPGNAPIWSNASSGWGLLGNAGTSPATNFIGTTDPQDLVFRTNSVENLRLSTSGNLGIGMNAPVSRLHIHDAAAPTLRLTTTMSGVTSGDGLEIGIGNLGPNDASIMNREGGLLILGSSTNQVVFINSGGNVGINNASPSSTVDVAGDIEFSGALLPGNQSGNAGQLLVSQGPGNAPVWSSQLFDDGTHVGIGTTTPHAPLQFANPFANRKIVLNEFANNDHQFFGFGFDANGLRYQVNTGGAHVFYSAAGPSTSGELFRIAPGYVSIGGNVSTSPISTPPGSAFDVNIDQGSTGGGMHLNNSDPDGETYYGYAVQNNSRARTYLNGTDGSWHVNVNGADRFSILSNGNVGIGTLAPEQKLDVIGYLRIAAGSGASNQGLLFATPAPGFSSIIAGGRATTEFQISQTNNAPMTFLTNTTERMRIDGAGNVGIGTTNPSGKLDVNGTVALSSSTAEVTHVNTGPGVNMLPIAFISSDAGGNAGTGRTTNVSVVRSGAGVYDITVTGENFSTITNYVIQGTILGNSNGQISFMPGPSANQLRVLTFGGAGAAADRAFSVVLYKP